jgi:hypothetical protein
VGNGKVGAAARPLVHLVADVRGGEDYGGMVTDDPVLALSKGGEASPRERGRGPPP